MSKAVQGTVLTLVAITFGSAMRVRNSGSVASGQESIPTLPHATPGLGWGKSPMQSGYTTPICLDENTGKVPGVISTATRQSMQRKEVTYTTDIELKAGLEGIIEGIGGAEMMAAAGSLLASIGGELRQGFQLTHLQYYVPVLRQSIKDVQLNCATKTIQQLQRLGQEKDNEGIKNFLRVHGTRVVHSVVLGGHMSIFRLEKSGASKASAWISTTKAFMYSDTVHKTILGGLFDASGTSENLQDSVNLWLQSINKGKNLAVLSQITTPIFSLLDSIHIHSHAVQHYAHDVLAKYIQRQSELDIGLRFLVERIDSKKEAYTSAKWYGGQIKALQGVVNLIPEYFDRCLEHSSLYNDGWVGFHAVEPAACASGYFRLVLWACKIALPEIEHYQGEKFEKSGLLFLAGYRPDASNVIESTSEMCNARYYSDIKSVIDESARGFYMVAQKKSVLKELPNKYPPALEKSPSFSQLNQSEEPARPIAEPRAICLTAPGAELQEDGLGPGYQCELPFEYNGVTYNACTEVDDPGRPWCQTIIGDKWGYCELSVACKGSQSHYAAPQPMRRPSQQQICPAECGGCWNNELHPYECLNAITGYPNANKGSCEAHGGTWCIKAPTTSTTTTTDTTPAPEELPEVPDMIAMSTAGLGWGVMPLWNDYTSPLCENLDDMMTHDVITTSPSEPMQPTIEVFRTEKELELALSSSGSTTSGLLTRLLGDGNSHKIGSEYQIVHVKFYVPVMEKAFARPLSSCRNQAFDKLESMFAAGTLDDGLIDRFLISHGTRMANSVVLGGRLDLVSIQKKGALDVGVLVDTVSTFSDTDFHVSVNGGTWTQGALDTSGNTIPISQALRTWVASVQDNDISDLGVLAHTTLPIAALLSPELQQRIQSRIRKVTEGWAHTINALNSATFLYDHLKAARAKYDNTWSGKRGAGQRVHVLVELLTTLDEFCSASKEYGKMRRAGFVQMGDAESSFHHFNTNCRKTMLWTCKIAIPDVEEEDDKNMDVDEKARVQRDGKKLCTRHGFSLGYR